jgi:flavin reductase (DIM6/NTAB) family NADH-FMN oxidoreductase RutF
MSEPTAALFQRLTQGVYVVGVAHRDVRNAFTAAWVMQVSYDPLLLALSINPTNSSYLLLKEGRSFSVNVLKKDQFDLADLFGRSDLADKLALTKWTTGRIGLPLLREALAWFECQVVSEHRRRRPRAGAGKGDRRQAVRFRSRTHVLSRNWRNGRRLYSLSRRSRRAMTHLRKTSQ